MEVLERPEVPPAAPDADRVDLVDRFRVILERARDASEAKRHDHENFQRRCRFCHDRVLKQPRALVKKYVVQS
jgi:hypothetical protein